MDTLLPEEYRGLELPELAQRIQQKKEDYKGEMLILGHHYQRDEIIRFSDYIGDSYILAETAAKNKDIRYTVFCGVSFMAESARILAGESNIVVQPDTSAGCPLADMADIEDVEKAWKIISSAVPDADIVPITYINSSSALKSFCGENNGIVCTSSNAEKAMSWGFKKGEKVFFFPDYNLGINTANKLGIAGDRIVKWDPTQPFEGHSDEDIKKASVILWDGYCHVHTLFQTAHVKAMKEKYPDGVVIVHPECFEEVVEMSDYSGSTGFIVKYVEEAKVGSTIIIGTEINLVRRLAKHHPDKKIVPLNQSICPNMWKISLSDLLWTLDNLGNVNVVTVPDKIKENAAAALERMLELK